MWWLLVLGLATVQALAQAPPTNGHSMAGAGQQGLLVNSTSGLLRGRSLPGPINSEVRSWLGVPYALPPLGPLRFLPPRPPTPGPGIRECASPAPACVQPGPGSLGLGWNLTTSEDCLTLDILSPSGDTEGVLLPVLVWLHGGGFSRGSSSLEGGAGLASRGGVVLVTVQYRLGALGFLGLQESDYNVGLRDQALALSWVERNIGQFGGDPARITLAGQEAGAISVGHLLPRAPHLQGAILQSGGPGAAWARLQPSDSGARSQALALALGCVGRGSLACLRQRTAHQIVEAQEQVCSGVTPSCFLPTMDGDTVLSATQAANISSSVPILMGVNSNEGFLRLMQFLTREFPTEKLHTEGFSRQMSLKMVAKMFPNLGSQSQAVVDFLYTEWGSRGEQKASARFLGLERMVADSLYTCSQDELVVRRGQGRVYRYEFAWQPSRDGWPVWSGVKQGDELQFLLGWPLDQPAEYLIEEKELSRRVMQYWTTFMKTGSPGPSWPPHTPSSPLVMKLTAPQEQPQLMEPGHGMRCAVWASLLPSLALQQEQECRGSAMQEVVRPGLRTMAVLHVEQPLPETRGLGEEQERVVVEKEGREQRMENMVREEREEIQIKESKGMTESEKKEKREEGKTEVTQWREGRKSIKRKVKARARQAVEEALASKLAREVERALGTTQRTMRALDSRGARARRLYGQSQVPQSKEVSSSLQVLAQPTPPPKAGFVKKTARLTKPRNTQLSAQLSVGLSAEAEAEGESWAVYEPQKVGNSPIYIAPSQYSLEDARPYRFSGYKTRQSFSEPVSSLVRGGSQETTSSSPSSFSSSSSSRSPTPKSKGQIGAYDPFYPNYQARKAPIHSYPRTPVVLGRSNSKEQSRNPSKEQSRNHSKEQNRNNQKEQGEHYFPNYFPRSGSL